MAEITKERLEAMLRPLANSDEATERVSVKLSLAEFKPLAALALIALRQQEGMVLVPRDLLTAAGLTLPADSPNAKRVWAILNAASERDQRGAAAGDSEKPVAAVAKSEADREVCGTDTGPQSAPHPDLLRGIALGIEAARQMVGERMDSLREEANRAGYTRKGSELSQRASEAYELHQWLSTVTAADIAAKNPTDDAAGRM